MIKSGIENRIDALSPKGRKLFLLKLEQSLLATSSKPADSGNKRVVAYVQGKDGFDKSRLTSYLRENLPDFMMPSSIIALDKIPTLPNGKIDEKKLSEFKTRTSDESVREVGNLSDPETKLTAIWEEVLNFSPIDISDNFFEIGGDSILSIQIIAKSRKMGIMISPNQLFEHQTIAALAQDITEKLDQEHKWEFLVPLRKEGTKKPLFCVHSGGGHVFFYNLLTEYMKPERPIYALQSSGLDGKDDMHKSIQEMTQDYIKAMRTIQPEGPYNVLVYCFSATVGNEMAIQLAKFGQEINIIVIDTMASPWNLGSPDRLRARVRSFLIRFFKEPLKSVKTFFEDRFWRISPLWFRLFGDENQRALEKVKINLREICLAYEWKSHTGRVSLILTEKPHESLQRVTVDSWKELSPGRVELFYTKGNHRTIFEEPDVRFVSEKIDESLVG